jgi:two-component system nitrate/nitrite response regulator NarL
LVHQEDTVRIIIADDHPIFRNGLKSVLEEQPGLQVVGEAGSGAEAVGLARALRPDVLLLDLAMPGLSGMETLGELADESEPIPVRTILLTASIQRPEIVKALQLGAAGVVLKTDPPELLFKSIRAVMAGQYWVGRDCLSDLVAALHSYGDAAPEPRQRFGLTPREFEITSAVVLGFSNKQIAQKYVLREDTVKHHLTRIFDKVGASNRLELALFAVHHGLLEDQEPSSGS